MHNDDWTVIYLSSIHLLLFIYLTVIIKQGLWVSLALTVCLGSISALILAPAIFLLIAVLLITINLARILYSLIKRQGLSV